MVVADTESTLLMPRLPPKVIAGLAGGTPLGTLLEPYGVLRLDRLAIAVNNEFNERGERIAVRLLGRARPRDGRRFQAGSHRGRGVDNGILRVRLAEAARTATLRPVRSQLRKILKYDLRDL